MVEKKQKNIESKTLLTILTTKNEQKGSEVHLRCVDWIVGTKHYPKLEKRELFTGDDGEMKTGKAAGFTLGDLALIQKHWNPIMRALGSKLPEHQEGAVQKTEAPAAASAPATPTNHDF